MIRLKRWRIECAIALFIALFPLALLAWIFDRQVPESVADDISARVYPDTLALAWILLSALHLLEALWRRDDRTITLSAESLGFKAGLILIVVVGFGLLHTVGYLVAAAFYIFAFTWILNERGWAAKLLAVATPIAVYSVLVLAFDVRLPSLLDRWWY